MILIRESKEPVAISEKDYAITLWLWMKDKNKDFDFLNVLEVLQVKAVRSHIKLRNPALRLKNSYLFRLEFSTSYHFP